VIPVRKSRREEDCSDTATAENKASKNVLNIKAKVFNRYKLHSFRNHFMQTAGGGLRNTASSVQLNACRTVSMCRRVL